MLYPRQPPRDLALKAFLGECADIKIKFGILADADGPDREKLRILDARLLYLHDRITQFKLAYA